MFWGCFSYDYKGPCYIWKTETAQEKIAAEKEFTKLNKALEPIAKIEWELATSMRRVNLNRRPGGRALKWKWNKANGKLIREGKTGGINWYRYWKVYC